MKLYFSKVRMLPPKLYLLLALSNHKLTCLKSYWSISALSGFTSKVALVTTSVLRSLISQSKEKWPWGWNTYCVFLLRLCGSVGKNSLTLISFLFSVKVNSRKSEQSKPVYPGIDEG